jgi:hypothetical protein
MNLSAMNLSAMNLSAHLLDLLQGKTITQETLEIWWRNIGALHVLRNTSLRICDKAVACNEKKCVALLLAVRRL